jgi:hypothetical protein
VSSGGERHDPPCGSVQHRSEQPGQRVRGDVVDLERRVDAVVGQAPRFQRSGVVDENVELFVFSADLLGQVIDLRQAAEIRVNRTNQPGVGAVPNKSAGGRVRGVSVSGMDEHDSAAPRELMAQMVTDTPGPASDQNNSPMHDRHGSSPSRDEEVPPTRLPGTPQPEFRTALHCDKDFHDLGTPSTANLTF